MTPKLVPALAAALFLAACSSGSHTATPQPPDSNLASGTPNGQVVPGSVEDSESGNIGNTVYFETDSSALTAASQAQLQKEAAWLQQYRQHTATIEGHADERGTREYNLALGERRAQSVVRYLTALGIDPARLKEISYGKERPICTDATEACWSQNRRGVTTIDN